MQINKMDKLLVRNHSKDFRKVSAVISSFILNNKNNIFF